MHCYNEQNRLTNGWKVNFAVGEECWRTNISEGKTGFETEDSVKHVLVHNVQLVVQSESRFLGHVMKQLPHLIAQVLLSLNERAREGGTGGGGMNTKAVVKHLSKGCWSKGGRSPVLMLVLKQIVLFMGNNTELI